MEDFNQPLLPTSTNTKTTNPVFSNFGIVPRLLLVLTIGVVSTWATYESSKGFQLSIANEIDQPLPRKRFAKLYVSTDKATRVVLNASSFVEKILHDGDSLADKKLVRRITLRLSDAVNLTDKNGTDNVVDVNANTKNDEFVVSIGSSIMYGTDIKYIDYAFKSLVLRGMARVWLLAQKSIGPQWIEDGVVEYVVAAAGFGSNEDETEQKRSKQDRFCSGDNDTVAVACIFDYVERNDKGFVGRFVRTLGEGLDDRMVEDKLRMSIRDLCESQYMNSSNYFSI